MKIESLQRKELTLLKEGWYIKGTPDCLPYYKSDCTRLTVPEALAVIKAGYSKGFRQALGACVRPLDISDAKRVVRRAFWEPKSKGLKEQRRGYKAKGRKKAQYRSLICQLTFDF